MELLYNPERMPEQEIKDTFVARQELLDRLVRLVERQPEGAGVQHIVIVAPRGMGKTTLLLMLQFAIEERNTNWQPVRFPEEMYSISNLADFWLETLDNLSRTAGDRELGREAKELPTRYRDENTLQEAALSLLRDWCRRGNRRLILLVDNFQNILSVLDEQEAAALRNVLMNEGFLMLIGAAPSFFDEASQYDQPLYNFFKIEHLRRLSSDEITDLLSQRAAADDNPDFKKHLAANRSRLQVLEYFTGGNARLVLMLYQVVGRAELIEARDALERLLDQVTPIFRSRTEELPPQQRKILDQIARAGSASHEGVSPSEIAAGVRLPPQTVSAQLKRLSDAGYVQAANLRGRTACYVLSERLYALWYQMRFARDAREKMMWLVDFLRAFYSRDMGIAHHSCAGEERVPALESGNASAWYCRGQALAILRRFDEALECFDECLNRDVTGELGPSALLKRFEANIALQRVGAAEDDWRKAFHLRSGTMGSTSVEEVINATIFAEAHGQGRLVRKLIAESGVDDQFFPLVRALDYVESGDQALIEKLTPEMRPIVEQVVERLIKGKQGHDGGSEGEGGEPDSRPGRSPQERRKGRAAPLRA